MTCSLLYIYETNVVMVVVGSMRKSGYGIRVWKSEDFQPSVLAYIRSLAVCAEILDSWVLSCDHQIYQTKVQNLVAFSSGKNVI
jgi:hypothetical protein